ncbi:putative NAD(P)H-dependent FMN-containing oxidoreductase YwqN [Paraliobacillus ryukyuensis]|uniref:Multimeric flavodoxin WrbA n=1 Tax=Paraliobacillus ryukyuensis TaxID=200904 RepID=A0A366DYX1_9BACI|nr:flavodoxin family protein [Paraliobacillus ryukyuensis]RBO95296.1 multimeric flavodoxin WrbA [Paraliobacillus ryukyuensis]
MTIGVIYGGTRVNGNTEVLTERVIHELPVERIYLSEFEIKPIEDQRHVLGGFQNVNDDYNTIIDRWSQTLKDIRYANFKDVMSSKSAYIIAVGGDEPFLKGIPLIQQFQYIFDFIGITFVDYVVGTGNKPNEILQDDRALASACQMQKTLKTHI